MKKFLSLSFVLLIICTKQYAQSAKQCFQPGDKVCFIGNSITQMGHYHYFVNLYYMLHYPEMQLETYNCGISGNMGFNVLKRIQRDILVHKPTVATLMLGMNDVNRELYEKVTTDTAILNARDRSIELYRKNVDSIAQQLTKNHCRLIFLTPSIYDQESKIEATNNYGVNDALGICAKFLKTLAPKYNAQVVDFNGEMNKINHLGLAMDQNFALAGNDRIHPDIWGHFIMASIFLKTLEMPSFVSKIEIDFANQKVTSSQNCEISGLKSEKSQLTFQCLEKSLPFPISDDIEKAIPYTSFQNDFNQEILKITNLKPGNYQLLIDNDTMAKTTAKELGLGLNLATITNTPQYKQAEKVMKLSKKYHEINSRLRELAMFDYNDLSGMKNPGDMAEAKILLDKTVEYCKDKPWYSYIKIKADEYIELKPKEAETRATANGLLQQAYAANKPQKHIYTIKPIN